MDLFGNQVNSTTNLLPYDGIVNYHGKLMNNEQANQYYNALMSDIEWQNDIAIIFGKRIVTKRKVAWHGSQPFEYTYSNNTKMALPWNETLISLKKLAEKHSNESFNSCLLNLYHDGSEGMAWHSDGEKDLKKNGAIASMSFGAERKFAFKHKETKEKVDIVLQHGSLLMMKGTCQTHWLHRLPPTKKIHSPRINLTFRTIVKESK